MSVKVVVVGDVLADLRVHMERLPRPHQTAPGEHVTSTAAGRGTLQAVAAARLGATVTLIARVGDDVLGELVARTLTAAGVQTVALSRDASASTGVLLGFTEPPDKIMRAHVPGANATLTEQHIKTAADHITGADVLITSLAAPSGAVVRALQIAADAGVRTVLKPTPFQPMSSQVLALPDVLTPNEEELRALAHQTDKREATPGQVTVCTLGGAGAHWFQRRDGMVEAGRVPGFAVRVVDTTGAGDVFSVALGLSLAEGTSLTEAIRMANAAGALSTTARDPWCGAPTREAVAELLAAHPAG